MDGFRRSKTGAMCSLTSEIASQDSGELASPRDSPVTESMSTEWTDEKHSLYIESMETSFVNQLYHSVDLVGGRLQKEASEPKSSRQVHFGNRDRSGQFKVLRHGCWQKIYFQKTKSQQNVAEASYGLLASPWIQHFMSVSQPQAVGSPVLQDISASKSPDFSLSGKKAMSCGSAEYLRPSHQSHSFSCQHELVNGNTEMSDQNFEDEDVKTETTSNSSCSKRMKL
ncbi:hypothetical protein K2173_026177 [Erythroxylum novogranatense]|uniref:Uncharacterized protein n=1 Tax=Erythroxylum novogranatense TaxID=1862640 RepID=A0AAV8TAD0_9ROSI|nr:hypothetical protein K2173_026177 [Erythroxylum novogranatense]